MPDRQAGKQAGRQAGREREQTGGKTERKTGEGTRGRVRRKRNSCGNKPDLSQAVPDNFSFTEGEEFGVETFNSNFSKSFPVEKKHGADRHRRGLWTSIFLSVFLTPPRTPHFLFRFIPPRMGQFLFGVRVSRGVTAMASASPSPRPVGTPKQPRGLSGPNRTGFEGCSVSMNESKGQVRKSRAITVAEGFRVLRRKHFLLFPPSAICNVAISYCPYLRFLLPSL
ncbi:hypothetical protein RUM43_001596 [Polyplax serrata]|uniref:Uncharacterized protein n=1 Tax=Polyplax serrata TaxID=468196 RepID=A0AAN8SJT5_POLSC